MYRMYDIAAAVNLGPFSGGAGAGMGVVDTPGWMVRESLGDAAGVGA
jgi:hypothetical protein